MQLKGDCQSHSKAVIQQANFPGPDAVFLPDPVQLTRLCPLHYLRDSTQSIPKLCRSSFDFSVTGSGHFPVLTVRTAGCTAHLQVREIFSHSVSIYPVLFLFRCRVAWQGATMYFTKRCSFTPLKYFCFNTFSFQVCNPSFVCDIIFTCEWMVVLLYVAENSVRPLICLPSLFRDYIFPWVGEPGGCRCLLTVLSAFYEGQTSTDLPALGENVKCGCAFCPASPWTSLLLQEGVCNLLNGGGWIPWRGVYPHSFLPFN